MLKTKLYTNEVKFCNSTIIINPMTSDLKIFGIWLPHPEYYRQASCVAMSESKVTIIPCCILSN